MKLLLLGANSQLGRALESLLSAQGVAWQSVGSQEIDLPRKQDVIRLVSRFKPDQVINVASYTDLEKAEKDPEAARLCDIVNTQGVSVLAEVCNKLAIPLLHHSSSYVFDGQKLRPYEEDETTNPVCRYGLSKWYGERAIRDTHDRHIILRTDWLFSPWRDRFFRQHIEACKQNAGQTVVMEHRFSPTPAVDVARVLLAIARQIDCQAEVWGTYHYSALQPMNEEQFVEMILREAMEYDEKLAALGDDIRIEIRPVVPPYIANTTLSSQKIMETFGIKPRSRAAEVSRVIACLYGHEVVADIAASPAPVTRDDPSERDEPVVAPPARPARRRAASGKAAGSKDTSARKESAGRTTGKSSRSNTRNKSSSA